LLSCTTNPPGRHGSTAPRDPGRMLCFVLQEQPPQTTPQPAHRTDAETAAADLLLVRSALAGSAPAIDQLVQRLACVHQILAAHNLRTGRLFQRGEIEDLTQDTMLSIWRKLDQFRGEAALKTWMFRFCFQEFMNALRRKVRDRGRGGAGDQSLPEDLAADRVRPAWIDSEWVYHALARLDAEEAQVIRLKYFAGLTFTAMASELGRSSNTLKAIHYRGLRRMQAWLLEQERA
jgi:RNA polymerase sigma-70 factor (ECF subfamily)